MTAKNSDQPEQELAADQVEQVNGGIGLLLPAVQKVREAATRSGEGQPAEHLSLNFTKVEFQD